MELELTEEQSWISESIDTLLSREWVAPQDVVGASAERRRQTWTGLVEFGSVGIKKDSEDGLGAVELCLIARPLGSHLASVPFLGSAPVRLALAPQARSPPAGIPGLPSRPDPIGLPPLEAGADGTGRHILDVACRYAGERRQFGRTIGSFQALRHILADAYVRQESGWSAVRYAAAALDDGDPEAAQAASIAKAYVSRGAREVAHSAMQVFGGIAFTADHPAHRFLPRISVLAQQFGDAAHHERRLRRG